MIRRDPNGDTSESHGVDLVSRKMKVADARNAGLTCERNGFELRHSPVKNAVDFLDHQQVTRIYYPECAALVSEVTGGRAYAFDHNIRSATGQQNQTEIRGGQRVQGPAHVVHGDYTLRGAPERLAQLAEPPEGNDTLKGVLKAGERLIDHVDVAEGLTKDGRFAIINVWRNIDDAPVSKYPMALCDGQTVSSEDLVVFEIHYPNRIGENYFAHSSRDQKMYYYPQMTPDEALLIKQWDSAGPLARSGGQRSDNDIPNQPCTFSFHSAFEDPDTPEDAPDRWSIEVRCVVLYD
jgi:hypothetical protein